MRPPQDPSKLFTLYGLKRPDDNIIRYIGITCQRLCNRLSSHIREASKKKYHKDFWVSKMLPLRPEMIPFAVGLTQEEALDLEIFVIAEARKQGRDLVNQTMGGEGGPGLSGEKHPFFGKKQSDKTKAKRSLAMMGKKHTPETRKIMSEREFSEEHRRNLSIALTGKKRSEESKRNQSIANTGKKQSPETCARRSESHRGEKNHFFGKHHTSEANEKNRIAHTGKKTSLEHKKALREGREKWRATQI